jgi:hypothetical protein
MVHELNSNGQAASILQKSERPRILHCLRLGILGTQYKIELRLLVSLQPRLFDFPELLDYNPVDRKRLS